MATFNDGKSDTAPQAEGDSTIYSIGGIKVTLIPESAPYIARVIIGDPSAENCLYIHNQLIKKIDLTGKKKKFGTGRNEDGHAVLYFSMPQDKRGAVLEISDIQTILKALQKEIPDNHTLQTATAVQDGGMNIQIRNYEATKNERAIAELVDDISDICVRSGIYLDDGQKRILAEGLVARQQERRGGRG